MTRRAITATCYLVEAKTRQEWSEQPGSVEMPDHIFDCPVRDRTGERLVYLRCGVQGLGAVPQCQYDGRLICASYGAYYRAMAAAVNPLGYTPGGVLRSRVQRKFLSVYYFLLLRILIFCFFFLFFVVVAP